MKQIIGVLLVLLISQTVLSKVLIEGVSAQKLALEIFQMTERKTSLSRFNKQKEVLWENLIRCRNNSTWSCELLGVNANNIRDSRDIPADMDLLDEDIHALVDDLNRSSHVAMSGNSTSGWAQKLFFRKNQKRIRLLEASTRRRNNLGFLRIEFVSCLIRPQRLGDIHYCWLRGVRHSDIKLQ